MRNRNITKGLTGKTGLHGLVGGLADVAQPLPEAGVATEAAAVLTGHLRRKLFFITFLLDNQVSCIH